MTKQAREIQVKSLTPMDFSLKEDGSVDLAFSTLGIEDEDGHVTLPGAIPTKEVAMSDYSHSSWPQKGGRLPVGKGTVQEEGNKGVFRGRFFLKTDHGRNAYETVKEMGDLQEWSYGYEILSGVEMVSPSDPKTKAIGLASLDIHEVSPVLLGAAGRGNTQTLGIKSLDGEDLEGLSSDRSGISLAGIPLGDHTDRLLIEVNGWKERLSGLLDLRIKEGRVLSTVNRDRIRSVAETLDQVDQIRKDLLSLLEQTDPEKDKAQAKALLGQYLQTQSRILGVQVSEGAQE